MVDTEEVDSAQQNISRYGRLLKNISIMIWKLDSAIHQLGSRVGVRSVSGRSCTTHVINHYVEQYWEARV